MGFTQPFNGSSAPSTSTSGGTTTTTSTTSGGQITTTTTTTTTPTTTTPTTPIYTPPTTTNITNIQGNNGIVVLTNSAQNSLGSTVMIGGTNGINVNTSDGTPYTDIGNGIMQIGKSDGNSVVVITGNTYAPAVFCTSDERLKTGIKLLENSLDKINKLKGVCYTWKDGHGGKEIGVIAQDIQAQFPELVSINKDNFLTVDYPKLTAVLIEGMKEMKKEMDTIKESLKRKPRQNKKNTEKETEKETEKKPRKTRVKKV